MHQQRGFTLVELMVALLLGTIISSVALMLFLSGQRSQALQQATSEIQDGSNFSLDYMVRSIRMANFSVNGTAIVNRDLANGGIVFNTTNLVGVSADAVTKSDATTSASNRVDAKQSDQLTVQYFVNQDQVNQGFFDCTGQRVDQSRYVAERYFIRPNGGLACASNGGGDVNNLLLNAQLILPGADYLRVLLSVQNMGNNTFSDVSIDKYNGVDNVVGIKLGILVTSTQAIGTNVASTPEKEIRVLDRTVKLSSKDDFTKNLRVVIEQTVALRNAIGGGV